eukprot:1151672-Pelagomonas_calceolata.AAC.2
MAWECILPTLWHHATALSPGNIEFMLRSNSVPKASLLAYRLLFAAEGLTQSHWFQHRILAAIAFSSTDPRESSKQIHFIPLLECSPYQRPSCYTLPTSFCNTCAVISPRLFFGVRPGFASKGPLLPLRSASSCGCPYSSANNQASSQAS